MKNIETMGFLEELKSLQLPPSSATIYWYQQRGYRLEAIINDVLKKEGLLPRTSFKTKSEQIDGSFVYNGTTFLLEAKWHKEKLPASSIYAFKGKVDGKLIGTVGIYISASGFLPDTINALSLGKTLNVLLFDFNDLIAAFDSNIGFRKVLEFKLRVAAEEGAVFVPFDLSKNATPSSPLYIVCEGDTDKLILDLINKKLGQLDNKEYQSITIIPAGGTFNIPKIANSLGSILNEEIKVILVVDDDERQDNIRKYFIGQIDINNWLLIFAKPFIEAWIFENVDEFEKLRRIKSIQERRKTIIKKLDLFDIEKKYLQDSEFQKYINAIRSNGNTISNSSAD